MSKRGQAVLGAYLIFLYGFLLLPMAVIILLSFNASPYGTLPFVPTGRWYQVLFSEESQLLSAAYLSLKLSFEVAAGGVLLGTPLGLWWARIRGFPRAFAGFLLAAAVTVPWLILAVAMLFLFNALGLGRSYLSMYLGNVAVSLPYIALLVAARAATLDPSLEEAARSLGARPSQVFRFITLPLLMPAVLAGAMMVFMVTFNNFVLQYFLAPFGVRTLPLEIYTLVRVGYRPDINALATFLVALALLAAFLLHRLVGLRSLAGGEDGRG
ncbi:MAG: ABC transporter permease [Clostridiales bacterium]|nr:ABC transporter permease [Clostridiales bacterium]